jgi:hypothetical protein
MAYMLSAFTDVACIVVVVLVVVAVALAALTPTQALLCWCSATSSAMSVSLLAEESLVIFVGVCFFSRSRLNLLWSSRKTC